MQRTRVGAPVSGRAISVVAMAASEDGEVPAQKRHQNTTCGHIPEHLHCPTSTVSSSAHHDCVLLPLAGEPEFKKNTEFGYSRKDVIIIGFAFLGLGYAMYYGLQAFGMEAGMAGAWVQLVVTLTMMIGWLASYLFRVANKVIPGALTAEHAHHM